ncbi:MAG: methyltransferase [Enterobacterales bacterium]|nr:methyltransferase [Enterobacterales bacterium]
MIASNILSIEDLKLQRYPRDHDPSLKACNAADEYLVSHLQSLKLDPAAKMLILNDQFGALGCAFANFKPDAWTDSFLSKQAIIQNLKLNNLEQKLTSFNPTKSMLNPQQRYHYLVIRVPKHNSLLEYQLAIIRQHLDDNAIIIAAGMTKEIHNSQLKIFQEIIGTTHTSLAKKKARLIFSKPDNAFQTLDHSTLEQQYLKSYTLKTPTLTAFGYPGVFSRGSLDQGAAVMLRHLPQLNAAQKIMDLGCGNGILGTCAAKLNPSIQVSFSDESWLAIESAKMTFERNIQLGNSNAPQGNNSIRQENKHPAAKFYVTDVLDNVQQNDFDLILCNPPFHQQNSQTLSIAKKMFLQSANKLAAEGELRVVANRHLHYAKLLKNYFNKVTIISKDPKFIVWQATSPKR